VLIYNDGRGDYQITETPPLFGEISDVQVEASESELKIKGFWLENGKDTR